MNPDQADAVYLLKLADAAHRKRDDSRTQFQRHMIQLARNLVKTEWVRIQTELQLPCRHVATHTVDARVIYRRREPLGPLGHLMVGCFDDASGVPDLLRSSTPASGVMRSGRIGHMVLLKPGVVETWTSPILNSRIRMVARSTMA